MTEKYSTLVLQQNGMPTALDAIDLVAKKYKPLVPANDSVESKPVDFRRVQHGHGPCACCGPYSE